mgnify:CR=1 FL=1
MYEVLGGIERATGAGGVRAGVVGVLVYELGSVKVGVGAAAGRGAEGGVNGGDCPGGGSGRR